MTWLWVAAPVAAVGMGLVLLIVSRVPDPDHRAWRGVHRVGAVRYTGRHEPAAPGARARQVDRVGEETVAVDRRRILGERDPLHPW